MTRLQKEISRLTEEQGKLEKQLLESTNKQEKWNKKFLTWKGMVTFIILDAGIRAYSKDVNERKEEKPDKSTPQRQEAQVLHEHAKRRY